MRAALFTALALTLSPLPLAQEIIVDNADPGFSSQDEAGVPILMYHGLDAEHGYSPADFLTQMDYLVANGYQTITLDHLVSWIQTGAPALPPKPVVLTFDDNYLSIYTVAYPALQARGFTGVNFAHTGYVGVAPGGSPPTSYDHADWTECIEMANAGVIFTESHTVNHLNLTTLGATQRASEIGNSRAAIQANMPGNLCRHFSYPFGAYSAAVLTDTAAAGYVSAVTTLPGRNTRTTPLLELRRNGVNPDSSMSTFISAVSPGAAWTLSSAQPDKYGADYRYHAAGTGNAVATWGFTVPTGGQYDVYAWWSVSFNRATDAPYHINHRDGTSTVRVNQQQTGGQWVLLGSHHFDGGVPATITLTDDANGLVIADAVRLVRVGPVPAGLVLLGTE